MICISGISLPFDEDESAAIEQARKKARLSPALLRDGFVVKRSLDARKREDIRYVYTVGLCTSLRNEAHYLERLHLGGAAVREETPSLTLAVGDRPLSHRPLIAGFGPAGMFCALLLAQHGFRPIVLERGAALDERVAALERFWSGGALDPSANVQFGEGGAGTFSDGKLTTRIGDMRCEWVLHELRRLGAPGIITRQAKPHIGTDRLRQVVKNLRREIISLGGEVHFCTALEGLCIQSGRLHAVRTSGGELPAEVLVTALGHSARDSFQMLLDSGLTLQPKAFSVGVRIEHRREDVNRALYGGFAGHPKLPEGEYQLSQRVDGRGVYTFCMCPGGLVVPASSEAGGVVVNGMSEFARDAENSNSALVVGVEPADFGGGPLGGVAFQQRLEQAAFRLGEGGYKAPVQTVGRFLEERPGADFGRVAPSYAIGVEPADFRELFDPGILKMLRLGLRAFGGRLRGFACPDAVLTGVESRTSSPVRVLRDESLQSQVAGVYPCGEGAGYAGGIMSAAVDGLRVAGEIIGTYRPC